MSKVPTAREMFVNRDVVGLHAAIIGPRHYNMTGDDIQNLNGIHEMHWFQQISFIGGNTLSNWVESWAEANRIAWRPFWPDRIKYGRRATAMMHESLINHLMSKTHPLVIVLADSEGQHVQQLAVEHGIEVITQDDLRA